MSSLRRKALVKGLPVNKDRGGRLNLTKLAGVAHFHFCSDRECRLIYEDSCDTPEVNGRCEPCRGRTRSRYLPVRDPQECCIDNCVQITYRPLLITHQLAGPGPWFQCKTCARAHGWPCTTT